MLEMRDKIEICPKGQMPSLELSAKQTIQFPYGVVVGPEKDSADSFRKFTDFFERDEFKSFTEGDNELFLIGNLTYSDIFSNVYELGFCAIFGPERSRFLMKGGNAYNYCRKIRNAVAGR
jgi:hypothetical protein